MIRKRIYRKMHPKPQQPRENRFLHGIRQGGKGETDGTEERQHVLTGRKCRGTGEGKVGA